MKLEIPRTLTPKEAIKLQKKLAPLVKEESELQEKITNLVGCDATYIRGTSIAAATLVDYSTLQLLNMRTTAEATRFPYIPGLLAFREAPPVLRAIRGLRARSFVCLVDAHGKAHPRRFGLACFVGLALDKPTIGVAKSLLYGWREGNMVVDDDGSPLAEMLKLPENRKTIYVSVGHKLSLKDAVRIVKYCLTPHGPVPIRLAHEEVTRRRCRLKKSNPAS